MKKDYYVYIHYRKSNPLEPFYVGKGRGNRAWIYSNRSDWWHNIVNKDDGFRCEIVYRGLTEAEAHAKEIFIVALYGRKDLGTGCLVNMTNGGDGISNPSEETRKKIGEASKKRTHSEESRKKMSEAHRGNQHGRGYIHSEESRKKMSENRKGKLKGKNNPMFGKTHSEETLAKMSEASKKYWENKRVNGN
jgi:hypothetical protein